MPRSYRASHTRDLYFWVEAVIIWGSIAHTDIGLRLWGVQFFMQSEGEKDAIAKSVSSLHLVYLFNVLGLAALSRFIALIFNAFERRSYMIIYLKFIIYLFIN